MKANICIQDNHCLTNPFVALFLSCQLIKINNSPLDLHKAQFSGKDDIYISKIQARRRRKIQTPCFLISIHTNNPRIVTWNLRGESIGGIWNVMLCISARRYTDDVVMMFSWEWESLVGSNFELLIILLSLDLTGFWAEDLV